MHGEIDRFTPLREQSRRLQHLRLALERQQDEARGTRTVPPPDTGDQRESRRAYRTPVELAEEHDEDPALRDRKRTQPWTMRAVWRHRVGPAPTQGQAAAGHYLEQLMDVLDQHQSEQAPLTRSEAAYLRLQIQRWSLRAAGLDKRYLHHGTKPGRPRRR